MKNYDEFIDFNYLNLDDWRIYARKYIIPLFKISDIILRLRTSLEDRLKKNSKEEFNSNENIREILLGGINEQGNYETNSLARIFKRAIGVKIPRYDWIYYKKKGLEPFDQGIKCVFKETLFLFFVKKLKTVSSKILTLLSIQAPESNDDFEDLLRKPEKILAYIKDLYVNILNFSPNHNQQTFFVLNTICVPRFYIIEAYPNLKENFEHLTEILGLRENIIFPFETEEERNKYAIWGHSEEGLAYNIIELHQLIEEFFDLTGSSIEMIEGEVFYNRDKFNYLFKLVIKNPVNLREDFFNKVKESIIVPSELNFSPYEVNIQGYDKSIQLVTIKNIITKITNGYSPNTRYAFSLLRTKIFLTDFIEKVAPYLFLSIALFLKLENLNYNEILDTEELNESLFYEYYNRLG